MQGSKTDNFVKTEKKNRRFDDGLTKEGNRKKAKKSKRYEKQGYSH